MPIKYIVKEENEIIGWIYPDYTFKVNPKYNFPIMPYPLKRMGSDKKEVMEFFESRVISRDSDMIDMVLTELGLHVYDAEALIRRTRGQTVNDSVWLALDENEKWEDISYKLNTDMTTLKGFEP